MRLEPVSGTVVMRGEAHWGRCAFDRAALIEGVVTLAPIAAQAADDTTPCNVAFAGLAVDRNCRIFHPRAADGGIEYLLWGRQSALHVVADEPQPYEMHGM